MTPMLIVSSLEGACSAYAAFKPARVISLLSEDESVPCFAGISLERHLSLYVERESCAAAIGAAARERAREIVNFVREWDGTGDILMHCNRGVSRSTACAYIIMCMRSPAESEAKVAERLRKAAPYADPCPMLVSYADELLERKGRMIEAIEALPPPCPAISAPLLTLPVAA